MIVSVIGSTCGSGIRFPGATTDRQANRAARLRISTVSFTQRRCRLVSRLTPTSAERMVRTDPAAVSSRLLSDGARSSGCGKAGSSAGRHHIGGRAGGADLACAPINDPAPRLVTGTPKDHPFGRAGRL
ncbi:MAG: hypothetical protein NVSMB55_25520 [Mycobacteriales bacterium]